MSSDFCIFAPIRLKTRGKALLQSGRNEISTVDHANLVAVSNAVEIFATVSKAKQMNVGFAGAVSQNR